jgi:hypothetical protein
MKPLANALLVAALLLPCTVAKAEATAPVALHKLALLPMSGTNVHPGYLDAGRDILKDHLLATGRFYVISVPGQSGAAEAGGGEAIARAREAGAELAVVTHLSRLAGTGRLRLVAYRVVDGSIAHADTIAVAGGPDDLDPALKRLADGLATGQKAATNAELESVTQKQADPLLKESASKIFGLRLGTLVAMNRPGSLDPVAVPGIGVFWMYDARSFLGEIALDAHNSDGGSGFSVTLGGYYPFSRRNFTPYVGGGVAYSIVDFGGAGANGLRLQPAMGFLFGRLSTVQLRAELGYFFNTFGEREVEVAPSASASIVRTTTKHYAHGPLLNVGLGF